MSKISYILVLSLIALVPCFGQDVTFSQFFAAPIQLNPALAGVTGAPRININYRNQWPNWPNAYRTYAVSYEQPLDFVNSSLGVRALTDDAGDGIYRTNSVSAVYGYHLRFRDNMSVRFGIEAGILQTRLDWDKLLFGDQLDPLLGGDASQFTEENRPDNLQRTDLDFSAGLVVSGETFYGGVVLHHLNRPDESVLEINDNLRTGRPLRLTVHGGAQINFEGGNNRYGESFISPSILYARQADFSQLTVGMYSGYRSVFGGLWYRHSGNNADAAIALVGFHYQTLRIGYSYDLTISGLSVGTTGGTHELSLSISFADSDARQRRRSRTRYNDCFGLFK